MRRIPEKIKQFVREHAAGKFNKELAAMTNEKFGTDFTAGTMGNLKNRLGVKSFLDTKFNRGIHHSPATEFKKGHVPLNKGTKGMYPNAGGATKFKKGHRPHNYLPVGSETKTSDGYWKVKIADPKTWKMKHVLLWENAYGPIPKGKFVTFLDGNRDHCVLDNLGLISLAANCRRNQLQLYGNTSQLGRVAVATAELIAALKKRRD